MYTQLRIHLLGEKDCIVCIKDIVGSYLGNLSEPHLCAKHATLQTSAAGEKVISFARPKGAQKLKYVYGLDSGWRHQVET